jgi:hypothetical protein
VNDVLKKTLEVLEPLKRLADKFDVAPYNLSYPDSLRINGTGDNATMADVVRHHCFITLGECRRAKAVFKELERASVESPPSIVSNGSVRALEYPLCEDKTRNASLRCGNDFIVERLPISEALAAARKINALIASASDRASGWCQQCGRREGHERWCGANPNAMGEP